MCLFPLKSLSGQLSCCRRSECFEKLRCVRCHRILRWITTIFFMSGNRWHTLAAGGKFGISKRDVCGASIVILFDNLTMMP